MSVDFALKDIFRKKEYLYPYIIIIALIIALVVFLIHFTTSLGLNAFIQHVFTNPYFFSGGISRIFTDFTTLINFLMLVLAFLIVIIVTSSIVIFKKRDIAIMRAVGSIPRKVYNFYLTEVYIIFLVGFGLGIVFGFITYGIFHLIFLFNGVLINFQLDYIYLPILFISCILGIFFIPGVILRKLGNRNVIKSFSKDIPYDYDASKSLTIIPKWLSRIGFNFKISIFNTIRRKGEFKRYLIVFTAILLIVFTLTLGTFVLSTSSQQWLKKAQNENIIVLGHYEVISNYSLMYEMFSNPGVFITNNSINFLDTRYLFNFSDIDEISNYSEIEAIDHRILNFFNVEEKEGYYCSPDGGCYLVGGNRKGIIPILGINTSNLIQDFEIVGNMIEFSYDDMIIGDGLAYNFFDSALDQRIYIEELAHQFQISGIIIDSFYSGYGGYVDLAFLQNQLNLTQNEVNLVLIKVNKENLNKIQSNLEIYITDNLGENFGLLSLEKPFENNINYINVISLYPAFIIFIMTILSILSLYNYQKGGIMEKAKDFLIMRALGTKYKYIKRIMFLEALYVLIPALLTSLAIGMIFNSLFLVERTYLPPISLPLSILGILLIVFLLLNYLSIVPILKKIKSFTIKDFDIY